MSSRACAAVNEQGGEEAKLSFGKPTWIPFLLAVGIGSVVACGEPGERSAGPPTERVALADFVVESSQDDLASVPVRPLEAPEVMIGGWRQDSLPIPDVRDAVLMPDGSVWVAASTTHQVLTFSAHGRPLAALGGPGDGPGEFSRGPWSLHTCDDAVLVDEQFRYTLLSPDGELERVVVVPAVLQPLSPLTVGVSSDCARVLVRIGEVPPPRRGKDRGTDILAWIDPVAGTLDTITTIAGMERSGQEFGERLESMPTPFGAGGVWAQSGDSIYVGFTSAPVLTLFAESGRAVRTIQWEAAARPIAPTEIEGLEAARAQEIDRNPELAVFLPPISSYPIPATAPLFASVLVSDDGSVWVQEFPPLSDGFGLPLEGRGTGVTRYLVFDPAGKVREIVLVQSDVTIHQVRGSRVLASQLDDMGAPMIAVYRVPG